MPLIKKALSSQESISSFTTSKNANSIVSHMLDDALYSKQEKKNIKEKEKEPEEKN